MAAGAASVVAVLATAGIEAAKVAVLSVLGLMLAAAVAYFGVIKVLGLFGFAPGVSSEALSSAAVERHESEMSSLRSEHSGDWIYAWDNANGTRGVDDVDKWRH